MSDNVKLRVLDNIKEIRVLNDPYRQEILSTMNIMGRPATAKEIATAMKEAPSKVNYHIKVLEEYDFVEIDHTENINGIIAKYYKRAITNFDVDIKNGEDNGDNMNAAISMIQSMFNNARDKHLRRLKSVLIDEDKQADDRGLITSTKLYLTEDEIAEMTELINKFTKNDKEDRKLYNIFVSYIRDE